MYPVVIMLRLTMIMLGMSIACSVGRRLLANLNDRRSGIPRCSFCGYELSSVLDMCPECGQYFQVSNNKQSGRLRLKAVVGVFLCFGGLVSPHWMLTLAPDSVLVILPRYWLIGRSVQEELSGRLKTRSALSLSVNQQQRLVHEAWALLGNRDSLESNWGEDMLVYFGDTAFIDTQPVAASLHGHSMNEVRSALLLIGNDSFTAHPVNLRASTATILPIINELARTSAPDICDIAKATSGRLAVVAAGNDSN